MRTINVLVVDDSVTVRRFMSDVLSDEPGIKVVGLVSDGAYALEKIAQTNPDVVTLDVEMPIMGGLETLEEIRKHYPRLPVIMLSSLTEAGSHITLQALLRGASDYVLKPSQTGNVQVALDKLKKELVPKIKSICDGAGIVSFRPARIPEPSKPKENAIPAKFVPVTRPTSRRIDVVVIGSSTGGPNALKSVLSKIPADFPLPILVTQHMPPVFTTSLAKSLNDQCRLPVSEGVAGEEVLPKRIYLAPGGVHMVVDKHGTKMQIGINQDPPENSCRPAVDVLFRSAVRAYGDRVLAVVLTGMGQDGMLGCEAIKRAGGKVIVQDQATSVVWGMPGAVVNAGLADEVMPVNKIADEINMLARLGRMSLSTKPVGAS
jgi:two-component system chemotaxis response regulator CheB